MRSFTLAFSMAALALTTACADTQGRLVQIDVAVEAVKPVAAFETNLGWEVRLEQAAIQLGGLYAFAPADDDAGPLAKLRWLWTPATAHAHGGIDPLSGRRVRAEWLDPVSFNLLDDSAKKLGTIDAEAGAVSMVTVLLDVPAASDGPTHGHVAWVRGRARKDGREIAFEGGLDVPDEGLSRRIEGVMIDAALDDDDVWSVGVRPSGWFDDAHFERLEANGADDVLEITPESQVRSAWLLGVRTPKSYATRIRTRKP